MSQFIHRQQTATGQPPRGQVMIRRAALAAPLASEEPSLAGEVVDAGKETLQGAANVEIPADFFDRRDISGIYWDKTVLKKRERDSGEIGIYYPLVQPHPVSWSPLVIR